MAYKRDLQHNQLVIPGMRTFVEVIPEVLLHRLISELCGNEECYEIEMIGEKKIQKIF
jgi:hypothetical protein